MISTPGAVDAKMTKMLTCPGDLIISVNSRNILFLCLCGAFFTCTMCNIPGLGNWFPGLQGLLSTVQTSFSLGSCSSGSACSVFRSLFTHSYSVRCVHRAWLLTVTHVALAGGGCGWSQPPLPLPAVSQGAMTNTLGFILCLFMGWLAEESLLAYFCNDGNTEAWDCK